MVSDVLKCNGRKVAGIIDPGITEGEIRYGIKVLGGEEVLQQYVPEQIDLVNCIGFMPGNDSRQLVSQGLKDAGFHFTTICHPGAIVSEDVSLEEGVQVMAGVVIQPGVSTGTQTIINSSASIDHDCRIGEFCHIAPGVTVCGDCVIGDRVFVGAGTTIIQGVCIGDDSVIGAGSLVRQDIPGGSTYFNRRTT